MPFLDQSSLALISKMRKSYSSNGGDNGGGGGRRRRRSPNRPPDGNRSRRPKPLKPVTVNLDSPILRRPQHRRRRPRPRCRHGRRLKRQRELGFWKRE